MSDDEENDVAMRLMSKHLDSCIQCNDVVTNSKPPNELCGFGMSYYLIVRGSELKSPIIQKLLADMRQIIALAVAMERHLKVCERCLKSMRAKTFEGMCEIGQVYKEEFESIVELKLNAWKPRDQSDEKRNT